MSTWARQKLGGIVDFNTSSLKKDFPFQEIEYIDISSVGTGRLESVSKLDISDAPSRAKRLVHDGDTILATVRPNHRSFLYIKNPPLNRVVSTGFAVLSPRTVHPRFLYYIISQQQFTDYLTNNAKGATYPAVDEEIISRADINVPDFPTQTRIASVLSAYDDLIENNETRIKTLEAMAQLLYTEWFVKFNFPGHEKVKMVESGTEYGMIPEEWEVVSIGSLLQTVKRKPKIQTSAYLMAGMFPVVDQGREFIAGYTEDTESIYDQDLVVFGDHSRCFKYCNFPFACGADGTQLLLTNDSERMPETLLYYVVLNSCLQNFTYARHFKFLKSLRVIKPDSIVARQFDVFVKEFYMQVRALRSSNMVLAKMRDLLISQLVTGRRSLKTSL